MTMSSAILLYDDEYCCQATGKRRCQAKLGKDQADSLASYRVCFFRVHFGRNFPTLLTQLCRHRGTKSPPEQKLCGRVKSGEKATCPTMQFGFQRESGT